MITPESIDLCPIAWYTIMDVSRATYYHWKENAKNGMCTNHHINLGSKKLWIHTLQATATLRLMLEQSANHMPHKMQTLETRMKIVSKYLPSS
jgi:hypothetical protein